MEMVVCTQIELRSLITTAVAEAITKAPTPKTTTGKQYVYGLDGLSRLLNCSHPTAQRIKNSLPKTAYAQAGRKIVFDVDAVLTALNNKG